MNNLMQVSNEVHSALHECQPVVALESTIVSHGLPYPENLDTAVQVEATVRENGAIPATIAIFNGIICIGLDESQLHNLATSKNIQKLSSVDIAYAMTKGVSGSTTVASTLVCAEMAGIKVMATGGIGGIHRDFKQTNDISHDPYQIALSKLIVVSSGIKAILDIPRTLELMETLGIAVVTYDNDEFPAFWSRNSGIASPMNFRSIHEIVKSFNYRSVINLEGGMLVANPVPSDFEISRDIVEPWIMDALAQAKKNNVTGKRVTPYLLDKIYHFSRGQSVKTNKALVKNNARVASMIACELYKIN